MKTKFAKPESVAREWHVIDAKDQVLGRMATKVASILRGKHKPVYTPHTDTGDFVVVINAKDVKISGDKGDAKLYWRYSGYPGGERSINFNTQKEKFPERIVEDAVWGMLPKGNLGRKMFKKLKVYAQSEHPHKAQNPSALSVTA